MSSLKNMYRSFVCQCKFWVVMLRISYFLSFTVSFYQMLHLCESQYARYFYEGVNRTQTVCEVHCHAEVAVLGIETMPTHL